MHIALAHGIRVYVCVCWCSYVNGRTDQIRGIANVMETVMTATMRTTARMRQNKATQFKQMPYFFLYSYLININIIS